MKKGRFHLRLEETLRERMLVYAEKRRTSITSLIETYFQHLLDEEERQQKELELEPGKQI